MLSRQNELANFDDYEGHVVSQRALRRRRHAVQDCLLEFMNWPL